MTAPRQNARNGHRRTARGFTLVELLVAMAILSILTLALFMLFRASLGAYRSTKRAMDASEVTQTAFRVLERDVVQGFAAKHYGDASGFFGCPYGMTMICTLEAADEVNTARVSYVVHSFAGSEIVDTITDGPDVDVPTYGIIRYIEPGIDTLSNYPVQWPDYEDQDGPIEGLQRNLWRGLREIYVKFGPDPSATTNLADGTPVFNIKPVPTAQFQAMIEAKKHELWLAMLGDRSELFYVPGLNPGDPPINDGALPRLWDDPAAPGSTWRGGSFSGQWDKKYPEDYIIAEGVLATEPPPPPAVPVPMDYVRWFRYGYTEGEVDVYHLEELGLVKMIPYWHAVDDTNLGEPGDPTDPLNNYPFINNYGSPLYPYPPSLVAVDMRFAFRAPNLGEQRYVRQLSHTFQVPVGYRRPLMAVE